MAQSGQALPKDEEMFEAMPVKLEISQKDEIIKSLVNVEDQTVQKLIANQIYFNAMVSAGMMEDARTLLPGVTELMKTVIKQAVSKKIHE